jgi:hypothetical protein
VESAFGGSPESGRRYCDGAFGRNPASVAVKMFSHLIYFTKAFIYASFSEYWVKINAVFNKR